MTQFPLLGEEQSLKAFLRPSSSHTPSENIEKKAARLAGSGLMWIWVISREGRVWISSPCGPDSQTYREPTAQTCRVRRGELCLLLLIPLFSPSFYLDLLGAMIRGGDGAWELHSFKAPWGEHKGVWRPEGDFLSHRLQIHSAPDRSS